MQGLVSWVLCGREPQCCLSRGTATSWEALEESQAGQGVQGGSRLRLLSAGQGSLLGVQPEGLSRLGEAGPCPAWDAPPGWAQWPHLDPQGRLTQVIIPF